MRTEEHKRKMLRKRMARERAYRSVGQPLVLANISKNHPDYGMSPAEHEAAKKSRKNNS